MKIYLINKNPIISKLVHLSVSKLGLEISELESLSAEAVADIFLMDDECFEEESFKICKDTNAEAKFGLFYAKAVERIEGFDVYIQKPFLPTDLVKILSEVSGIPIIEQQSNALGALQEEALEDTEESSLKALNLDDNLDFESLDDLSLDENPSTEANLGTDLDTSLEDGDMPLDFGADDSTIESTEDSLEPSETKHENTIIEDLNAPLDFGADETPAQEPKILDKGEVEAIKDLLEDNTTSEENVALDFDLDKELNAISDDLPQEQLSAESSGAESVADTSKNADSDALDLSDLEAQLEGIGVDTATKSESEEKTQEDVLDFSDMDFGLDNLGLNDNEESKDVTPKVESDTSDTIELTESQNMESSAELSGESAKEEAESVENLESFGLSNDEEIKLEEDLAKIDAAGLQSDLESVDDNANATQMDLDLSNFELEDELSAVQKAKEEQGESISLDVDALTKDLESIEEDTDEDFEDLLRGDSTFEKDENPSTESTQAQENMVQKEQENISLESSTIENIGDEFDMLSQESMSEALGEPVQKAPNVTPIVQNNEALPSTIQANSLESLIGALQTLQTNSLKELLSGATINISIQFPKKDNV